MLEARSVSYRRCGRSLVRNVSLRVAAGDMLAISGPEGSGAATLLHVLAGHLAPDAGRVVVDTFDTPDPRVLATGPVEARAALDGDASIVLLDHPTLGLDPSAARSMLARCRARADQGGIVVLTVVDPELVVTDATTLAVMLAGRLIAVGAPEQAARAVSGLHAFAPRATHRAELERRLLEPRVHSVPARQVTSAV